jgi:hypothetical protein
MLKDIIRVRPLKDFRLHLEFEDGIEGEVDIRKLINSQVYSNLFKIKTFLGR